MSANANCPQGQPEYEFRVRPQGGLWEVRQDYSTSNTFDLDTGTLSGNAYSVQVNVRHVGTDTIYEAYTSGSFGLEARSCASVTASASPSPGTVDSTVTVAAEATCNTGNAQYRFRIQSPNGDWSEIQPYSDSTTFHWPTVGLTPGTYHIEVAARHPGSTQDHDSSTVITEELREKTGPDPHRVLPFVDCVVVDGERSFAVFGYDNQNTENLPVPRGDENSLLPAADIIQPIWFAPGVHSGAFVAELSSSLTWTIADNSASAIVGASPTCELVESPTGGKQAIVPSLGGITVPIYDDPGSGILETETTSAGVAAGTLDGTFHVTHDGSAAYSIPIWFPPSPIQPHLSLQYDSRNGNGLFGVGWNLVGDVVQEITRCRRTVAQDGYAAGITFSANDAFCLGRQRLIPISGANGLDGTEYRTEEESYVKVVSTGVTIGDHKFTAYLRDGRVVTYGPIMGRNATHAPSRAPTVTWDVRSIEDRSGNVLRFNYHDAFPEGADGEVATEHYLENVEFVSQSRADGPQIVRRIRIEYKQQEARPDKFSRYLAGVKVITRVEANAVIVESAIREAIGGQVQERPATTLRRYHLTLTPEPKNSLLFLRTVQECDGTGICKAPTVFDYTPYDIEFQRQDDGTSITDIDRNRTDLKIGDLDGDGRDDIVYKTFPIPQEPGCKLWYRLSTGRGFGPAVEMTDVENAMPDLATLGRNADLRLVDLDADGRTDVMISIQKTAVLGEIDYWHIFLSIDGGFREDSNRLIELHNRAIATASSDGSLWRGPPRILVGDMTGDGVPEILRAQGGATSLLAEWFGLSQWGVRLSQNGGQGDYHPLMFRFPLEQVGDIQIYFQDRLLLADVDGSGRLALLSPAPDLTSQETPDISYDRQNNVAYQYAKLYPEYGHNELLGGSDPLTVDFEKAKKQLSIAYDPDSSAGVEGYLPNTLHIMADMNGDGLPDAVGYPMDGGDVWVGFNYGGNFGTHRGSLLPGSYQLGQTSAVAYGPYWGSGVGQSTYPVFECDYRATVDNGLRVADIDQDGRQDLVLMDAGIRGRHGEFHGDIAAYCAASPIVTSRGAVSYLRVDDDGQWRAARLSPDIAIGIDSVPNNNDMPGFGASQILDINGDGLPDLVSVIGDGGDAELQVWTQKYKGGMLRQVDNAYGRQVNVEYKPISDRTVHTPGSCAPPLRCANRGLWVVASHEVNSGTSAGMNHFEHSYKGGASDLRGRGWLGFSEHEVKASRTHTTTTTSFDPTRRISLNSSPAPGYTSYAYSHAAKPISERTVVELETGHSLVTRRKFDYEVLVDTAMHTYRMDLLRVITNIEDRYVSPLGGGSPTIRATINELGRDTFGNVTTNVSITSDTWIDENATAASVAGDTLTIRSTYDNDPSTWLVGLERTRTQTNTTVNQKSQTRSLSFDYEPGTRLVHAVNTEPEDLAADSPANLRSTVVYEHDSMGQVIRVTQTTAEEPNRTTEITYDRTTGSLPAQVVNAEGHILTTVFEPMRGLPLVLTDSNGISNRFRYDGFGRLREHTLPDGVTESRSYLATAGIGTLQLTTTTPASGTTRLQFDTLERPEHWIADTTFNDLPRTVTRFYDASFGTVATESGPADQDTPAITRNRELDPAGRVIREATGDDYATYSYLARKVTVTEASPSPTPKKVTIENDLNGRMIVRTETNGSNTLRTEYTYGPFGMLETITDPARNVTTFGYDRLGRRITVSSRSSGTTTSVYNGFGELVRQIDGDLTVHSYAHDRLGRVYEEAAGGKVSSVEWDRADHGIGRVGHATSFDGVASDLVYDVAGRASKKTTTVQGVAYTVDLTYEPDTGRLHTMLYPALGSNPRFGVEYGYRSNGELESVIEATTRQEYWRATKRNARGQSVDELYGDGVSVNRSYESTRGLPWQVHIKVGETALDDCTYEYDYGRFLKHRQHGSGINETFTYDPLNRLEFWRANQDAAWNWTVQYHYDDLGNLTGRDYSASSGTVENVTYEYSGINAGPDAVTSSPWGSYGYDAKGNRISSPDGTIKYTPFDLPQEMKNVAGTVMARFEYDATGRRARKSLPGDSKSTVYVDGIFEHRTENGVDRFVHHVVADDLVVQVTWGAGGAGQSTSYVHTNGIGSVEMLTRRDSTGQIVASAPRRMDPFGNEVDITNPVLRGPGSRTPTAIGDVRRGFTGHEEDFELGLVNMKGRMYDPKVGRFLTADPLLTGLNSQALNRYSYVENDPMNRIDPTGFRWIWMIHKEGDDGGVLDVYKWVDDVNVNRGQGLFSGASAQRDIAAQSTTARSVDDTGVVSLPQGAYQLPPPGTYIPAVSGATAPPVRPDQPGPNLTRGSGVSGYRLSQTARDELKPIFDKFGFDISRIRVVFSDETNGNSGVTLGNYILINREAWSRIAALPGPRGGLGGQRGLLAHEITHSVQYARYGTFGTARFLARYAGEYNTTTNYQVPDALKAIPIDAVNPLDSRFTLDQIANRVEAEYLGGY